MEVKMRWPNWQHHFRPSVRAWLLSSKWRLKLNTVLTSQNWPEKEEAKLH